MHDIIFNNRLIPSIEVVDAILAEAIEGRWTQTATYLALNKKLMADIANAR